MDPRRAFYTDRSFFDAELNDLIQTTMSSSLPSIPEKRPADQEPPVKRLRMEHGSVNEQKHQDHSQPVPPLSLRSHVLPHNTVIPGLIYSNNVADTTILPHASFTSARHPDPQAPFVYVDSSLKPSSVSESRTQPSWSAGKYLADYDPQLQERRQELCHHSKEHLPRHRLHEAPPRPRPTSFPLTQLPENILERIFGFLLVKSEPITIDVDWGILTRLCGAGSPDCWERLQANGIAYQIPRHWPLVYTDTTVWKDSLEFALVGRKIHSAKSSKAASSHRGLDVALLRVSYYIHQVAADVLYGWNTFRFPCGYTAWMQLESFLFTIGAENVERLQHIRIHVPCWNRGPRKDHVRGALLDTFLPKVGLAVYEPLEHDRLTGAVRHAAQTLIEAGNLETLSLELDSGLLANVWSGRTASKRSLLPVHEVTEWVERKIEGIAALKDLSEMLAEDGGQPTLKLFHRKPLADPDRDETYRLLLYAALVSECRKYGWQVDADMLE